TGNAPGRPRHTGQTCVLGGAPKDVGHPQNILVAVFSSTCTSRPITGSNAAIASSKDNKGSVFVVTTHLHPRGRAEGPATGRPSVRAAQPRAQLRLGRPARRLEPGP